MQLFLFCLYNSYFKYLSSNLLSLHYFTKNSFYFHLFLSTKLFNLNIYHHYLGFLKKHDIFDVLSINLSCFYSFSCIFFLLKTISINLQFYFTALKSIKVIFQPISHQHLYHNELILYRLSFLLILYHILFQQSVRLLYLINFLILLYFYYT